MFYRYELYCGEDDTDISIYGGLSELDLDDDIVENLIKHIDAELQTPFDIFEKYRYTTFWFTEKGREHFWNEIETIIKAYQEHSYLDVKEIIVENIDNIVYEDELHIVQEIVHEDNF